MSAESDFWLNNYNLVGFTLKRGKAWHWKESAQGVESNHYPGAIPIEDVRRRLFNFTFEPKTVYYRQDELSGLQVRRIKDQVAWVASDDPDNVAGIFSEDYKGHQFDEWLLENVQVILNNYLQIGGAGLLDKKRIAYVQVEVEENIETEQGVAFRPMLLACTSFNGKISTTYKLVITIVVCDNTLSAALSEKGRQIKVRHTKFSDLRVTDTREALSIMTQGAEKFQKELEGLCGEKVSDKEWAKLMEVMVPMPEEEGRGMTLADKKRSELGMLWTRDERVAPWKGTAYGVLAAYNTWNTHYATVRGAARPERQMANVLTDASLKEDSRVMQELAKVKVLVS